MSFSLLIPTNKDRIKTLESPWIVSFGIEEVLVNDTKGISKSRNELSRQATTDKFVYADDDLLVYLEGWQFIEDLSDNVVAMLESRNHPISRLMVVPRKIFSLVGGFDEVIKHNAEDLDFYWTCLARGVKVEIIPSRFVDHEPHKEHGRMVNYFESAYVRVKHRKISWRFFLRKKPLEAIMRVIGFIYYQYFFKEEIEHAPKRG